MKINRRNLLRAMLASPVAALMSKVGYGSGSVKPVNEIPDDRPCSYPTQYMVHFAPALTVARMFETMSACSFGRLQPTVIAMNGEILKQLHSICPEIFHWHVSSEMSARGWRTYPFNGAEVVEDRKVKDGQVWFITPGQEDPRYHAQLIVGEEFWSIYQNGVWHSDNGVWC